MTLETRPKLTGQTKVLAVFGYPVRHSLSPPMHMAAIEALGLDLVYVPFEVPPDRLADAVRGVRAMGIVGVNLTIPLKGIAPALVDGVSPTAERVGVVNTLYWEEGALLGDSTDGPGFLMSLEAEEGRVASSALILGAGGSARAVAFALADHGCRVTVANRSVERAAALVDELDNAKAKAVALENRSALVEAARESELVVNCTSLGMTPNVEQSPLPAEAIVPGHVVYDLIYSPAETLLLRQAIERGARAINGIKMLVHQGALSFRRWTGIDPPLQAMEEAVTGAAHG